ncbi:MAG: energy transducer TonB, partial [Prevotella salivae]|nr:energy transducer TonB [Segatella salivae]
MEIKKSYRADIEHKRTTNFLLGLVLVLAMLYVGFEYTSGPADDSHNNDMTDD